jgi:shikimate kinase
MAGVRPALLRPVALTGFMGAGKSTVGPLLAHRLAVPFYDLDRVIEADDPEGLTVAELIARDGETRFREREHAVLARHLNRSPAVWALGGGAITVPSTRRVLEQVGARVVWLEVDWETVAGRIALASRPLLAAGAEHGRRLLEARAPLYRDASQIVVDARPRPEQVAATIYAKLVELGDVDG